MGSIGDDGEFFSLQKLFVVSRRPGITPGTGRPGAWRPASAGG